MLIFLCCFVFNWRNIQNILNFVKLSFSQFSLYFGFLCFFTSTDNLDLATTKMKNIWLCVFFTLIFCVVHVVTSTNTTLLLVQILFRHGDRSPVDLYKTDPISPTVWKEGLGKLTMLGRRQHYGFGKFLRKYYANFTTSSPVEIDVMSADCDRCIKSAESNLAAFYAPNKEWTFEENFPWQPIVVRYIEKDKDKYLEDESLCPKADEEQKRIVQSSEGQAALSKYKDMLENLTFYSGDPVVNWTRCSYLYDTLFIERKYNFSVPTWADPWWDEMEEVTNLSFFWDFNSHLMHRLRAGPFLGRVVENIKKKLAGDIPDAKVFVNSAHDTNVAVVMASLKLFNMLAPPYCASLIFELHQLQNGTAALRVLFLNSSTPETGEQTPHILVLDGCSEFCPFEYFLNFTKDLIPDDWDKECQLEKSIVETIGDQKITVGWFFIIMLMVIVMMTGFGLKRLYSNHRPTKDVYTYHLMQTD